ncbi:hypothetical protein ACLOJK_006825 [Asimina triloba]
MSESHVRRNVRGNVFMKKLTKASSASSSSYMSREFPRCLSKVLQPMAWFYEQEGFQAYRYLWRELLVYRLLQGYAMFSEKGDALERDIWGVPKRWMNPLPEPVSESAVGLAASKWLALMYIQGTCGTPMRLVAAAPVPSLSEAKRREERSQKRARPSADGDSSVDQGLSNEDISKLSSVEVKSPGTDHRDERREFSPHEQVARPKSREVEPLSERKATLSEAKVMRLQALLREGNIQSSVMVEYLRSDTYRCQEEFERAYDSQGGYMRALSDVTVLFPGIDLSPLYRAP